MIGVFFVYFCIFLLVNDTKRDGCVIDTVHQSGLDGGGDGGELEVAEVLLEGLCGGVAEDGDGGRLGVGVVHNADLDGALGGGGVDEPVPEDGLEDGRLAALLGAYEYKLGPVELAVVVDGSLLDDVERLDGVLNKTALVACH